jgi:signal transduction histidine kinase/HAMP domain-containing protein
MVMTQNSDPLDTQTGRASSRLRLPLSIRLGGFSVLLVLLAAAGVGLTASLLLRRLADEQAVRHVELGGRAALEMVERFGTEALVAAQVLADRPTLARLVAEGDGAGLEQFLARFCGPGGYAGCAVVAGGVVLAATPPSYDPPLEVVPGLSVHASADGRLRVSGVAGLAGGGATVISRDLGNDLHAALSAHTGMSVGIRPAVGRGGPARPRARGGETAYRTEFALPAHWAGEPAVLEVALPSEAIGRSLRALLLALLGASTIVSLLAAGGALVLSRSVSGPLDELARAARRIGSGDLDTPLRPLPGEETGALARTMDEMRRRLRSLTADLRRSEAEAQSVLGGIVEGVYAVDEQRRVRYLNPQAAAFLGVEPAEAAGRFCGDLLHPARPAGERPCEERCPIVRARSLGSTRATEVLALGGGRRRTVVVTSSSPHGGRQVQIIRDETGIEGARRARDAIVANVSHEFRTPLSAQLASLELLRGRLEDASREDAAFDVESAGLVLSVERSSLRLVHLVDNLLESVRLEAGQDSIRSAPVALDQVVEEAVELMAPLLSQRGQRIDVDLPYPLPVLAGDATRLTQVMVNLLANACKYAPEGTTVRVRAAVHPTEVRLRVEDEGPGLPAGAEGNIFNRFDRGGEPDTSGMGLGLWIVKSIVERHGGRVVAASLPGRGARFTVSLPTAGAS